MSKLHRHALNGELLHVIDILENKKESIDEVCHQTGCTALHYAMMGNLGFVRKKAAFRLEDSLAMSPQTQITNLLIAHHAKPVVDNRGRTPLMAMLENTHSTPTYKQRLITQFVDFEAHYYGARTAVYEKALHNLLTYGLNKKGNHRLHNEQLELKPKAVERFWETINTHLDELKNDGPKNARF